MPGAVAMPKTRRLLFRIEPRANAVEEILEQGQRQARARVPIGGGRESLAGPVRQFGAGRVAVEHLREKRVERGDRIEQAMTIGVAQFAANLLDDA